MSTNRYILGAGVGAAALALAGAASAGSSCLSSQTNPILNNDNCLDAGVALYVDPNGGCNFTPAQLQDIGAVAVPSLVELAGTVGTFIPSGGTTFTSRDLDWYTFTINTGAVVNINVRMDNADGIGGAPGFDSSVLFLISGGACPAGTTLYGAAGSSCNHFVPPFVLPPGTYTFVVTTPFETDATLPFYNCPAEYQAFIDIQPTSFGAVCAAATEGCAEVHAGGGCNDFACCESVCGLNFNCCDASWDQACVDLAVSECGYFIWNCDNPGIPVNDCANAAILVEPGDTVAVDTTGATTDGPNGPSSLCAVDIGLDVWYLMKAPSDGELTVNACGMTSTTALPNFDGVIAVYDVGTSATFDPSLLGSDPQACADDTCAIVGGPSQIAITNAVADHYYAIRIGGWFDQANPPDTGAGNVSFGFNSVIFNSGPQRPSTNVASGVVNNLGLSSGNVAAAFTRRWSAVPFTVPASDVQAYKVTQIIAKGFIPAADAYQPGTLTGLGWAIYKRNAGNPAPLPVDQVGAGIVPLPAPFDDPEDNSANSAYPIDIVDGPELEPGDYYVTVYGDNGGPAAPANFAWFIYSPDGIPMLEGGLHGWRSTTSETFLFYTGLTGVWAVQAGDDPNWIYNNSFRILGTAIAGPSCTPGPDRNGDGCVNGLDITIILGNWDPTGKLGNGFGPGDADCNGLVNGADLTIVLGNWLTGPNCP